MKNTKVTVTVKFEMEYDGKVTEDDIDINDIISDADTIKPAVDEAISNNPDPVADYLNGKDTAIRFLIGQVMRITRGKANPRLATQLLEEKLRSMR